MKAPAKFHAFPTALLGLLALAALHSDSFAEVPSNGSIVWASKPDGLEHNIYLMQADGSGATALTTTGARMPTWSPDGRWISYETVPGGRARVMRWDLSEDREVFSSPPLFWMHDNSGLICRDGDDFYLVDPDTGSANLMFSKDDFAHFSGEILEPGGITRDGRWLAARTRLYSSGYEGNNGYFDTAGGGAVVLDFDNPGDVWFFGDGCEPTSPPEGNWLYHVSREGYSYDIYRMHVDDLQDRSSYQPVLTHPDEDWGHQYFPRVSTDGAWIVYGATTGCHAHDTCNYEIFVHRMGGGNDNREQITFNDFNDQWPHMYVGDLWEPVQPELTGIEVVLASSRIVPGSSVEATAYPKDQREDPFAAVIAWSAGGGSMNPTSSGAAVTEHTSTYTSDGTEGSFEITAESGGITGTATIVVESVTDQHLKINCGSNDYDLDGWDRDDTYVTGGSDWTNSEVVDTTGVPDAAPGDVYRSVRHGNPHSYSIPVPDGWYFLRLHFAEGRDILRSMDYLAEGQAILTGFDIATEAEGLNKALVKEFEIEVSDGNGLQIEAGGSGDVFEAGIEIIRIPTGEEPEPDGDGGAHDGADEAGADDGGTGTDEVGADDGGTGTDEAGADDGGTGTDGGNEGTISGGCSGCASGGGYGGSASLWLLIIIIGIVGRSRVCS